MHMITVAFLAVIIYFGGWHLWLIAPPIPAAEVGLVGGLIRIAFLQLKVLLMVFFFMWVRWSFPRFRYDQLMSIGWKIMIPLGLVNLLVSAVAQEFLGAENYALKAIVAWLLVAACFAYGIMKVNPQGAASRHALAKS
jgi:NADH-quinone oxidoreductase subunit H